MSLGRQLLLNFMNALVTATAWLVVLALLFLGGCSEYPPLCIGDCSAIEVHTPSSVTVRKG